MLSYPPCQFSFFSRHSVPVYLPFRSLRPGGKYFPVYATSFLLAFSLITPRGQVLLCLRSFPFTCLSAYNAPGASTSLFTRPRFYLPFRLNPPGGKYFSVYAPSFLLAFPLITPRGQVFSDLALFQEGMKCSFSNWNGSAKCQTKELHRIEKTIIPRRLSVNPVYETRQPPRPGRSCYNLQKIFPIASFFIKNIHKSPKPLYNH